MTTIKVYGFCNSCYNNIISVIKSDKIDDTNTLYFCDKCNAYRTFNFSKSNELEKRIKAKKESE